jgi:hypothetical protein
VIELLCANELGATSSDKATRVSVCFMNYSGSSLGFHTKVLPWGVQPYHFCMNIYLIPLGKTLCLDLVDPDRRCRSE